MGETINKGYGEGGSEGLPPYIVSENRALELMLVDGDWLFLNGGHFEHILGEVNTGDCIYVTNMAENDLPPIIQRGPQLEPEFYDIGALLRVDNLGESSVQEATFAQFLTDWGILVNYDLLLKEDPILADRMLRRAAVMSMTNITHLMGYYQQNGVSPEATKRRISFTPTIREGVKEGVPWLEQLISARSEAGDPMFQRLSTKLADLRSRYGIERDLLELMELYVGVRTVN